MILDWSFSPSLSVPGGLVLLLVEVAERRGISARELLKDEQVSLKNLLDHQFRLPHRTFEKLISRTIDLTGQVELGYQLGLQMKTTHYELIGQAVRDSKTLRDTLEVCLAFSKFQNSSINLSKTETEEEVTLHFKPASADYDRETWAIELLMVGLASLGSSLVGCLLKGSARVMIDEPATYQRIKHILPGPVTFSCPQPSITFPRAVMDYPIVTPDRNTTRSAKAYRKQELGHLREQHSVGALVEEMLFDEAVGIYSMKQLAQKLNLSTRSLQRHLKEEGLIFNDIVEKIRSQQAMRLLREGDYSVSDIALLLGYSDAANFSRAFRRWSGESPSAFRGRMHTENTATGKHSAL